VTLGVRRWFDMDSSALAAASRAALAWDVREDEAELWLARPRGTIVTVGAFDRPHGLTLEEGEAIARRGSGGPPVRIGEGSLWIALLLPRVDALVACDEPRILNRHVRPLLKALTRSGALAHYFGRDWISVKHRPAAWIGFAHARATGRTVVEAVLACRTPFHVGERASFLGKAPGTIAEITGSQVEPEALGDAVVRAWSEASGRAAVDRGGSPAFEASDGAQDPRLEPPWAATVEEAIGAIGAGADREGKMRVGGELMASTDAIAELEARLAQEPEAEVAALVDATLGAAGVAIEGVREMRSVAEVIEEARRAPHGT
jgi:hypothetical protein